MGIGSSQQRSTERPHRSVVSIANELRQQIVQGKLSPGSQLPTQSALQQRFRASNVTVQRAVSQLAREGFLYSKTRQGTFVAELPPHLCRYALIFPDAPDGSRWVRFFAALANEAIRVQRRQPRTVDVYYGIDQHVDTEDFQRLTANIRQCRLAGLIFASPPFLLGGTPVLEEPGIPRVAIMERNANLPGLASVHLDGPSFINRALDYLAARGRRRVAMLVGAGEFREAGKDLQEALAARDMIMRPYWRVGFNPETAKWARSSIHLLMHSGQEERPDGLIIGDDNLVEEAAAGLLAAQVRIPEDMEVISHCNFPWPVPSMLAGPRLGYDARRVLQACLDVVDRQRQGQTEVEEVAVSACFEQELAEAEQG